MDDPLDPWLDAYRAEAHASPANAAATRARLLDAALGSRRWRSIAIAASVAATLMFANASVYAWFTGALDAPAAQLTAWLRAESIDPGDTGAEAASRSRSGRERTDAHDGEPEPIETPPTEGPEQPELSAVPAREVDTTPTRSEAESPSTAGRARGERVQSRGGQDARSTPPSAPSPLERESRAFEAAHDEHFGGTESAAALTLWERYLADYPEGRFVPEARFNRAVCLTRMGRLDEAQDALAPIADGQGAHAPDARQLLSAIREGRLRGPAPPSTTP